MILTMKNKKNEKHETITNSIIKISNVNVEWFNETIKNTFWKMKKKIFWK
jgi:hypothetical protein